MQPAREPGGGSGGAGVELREPSGDWSMLDSVEGGTEFGFYPKGHEKSLAPEKRGQTLLNSFNVFFQGQMREVVPNQGHDPSGVRR